MTFLKTFKRWGKKKTNGRLYIILAESSRHSFDNIVDLGDCIKGVFKSSEKADRFIKEQGHKTIYRVVVECDF